MTCDRYWRDGIVLVERGLDDPHRDGCVDCARAHASRRELVEALPLIGAGYTGDPHWQANVWRRIDGKHAPWRWRWPFTGALVVACVVALWIGLGRNRSGLVDSGDGTLRSARADPQFATIPPPGAVAMRSGTTGADAYVDDHLRVTVGKRSEVWIYRAKRLVLHCRAQERSDACAPDADGMIVDLVLSTPGTYVAIAIVGPGAAPLGRLDEDRAALELAGAKHVDYTVLVH
jgi:hypothetical protein